MMGFPQRHVIFQNSFPKMGCSRLLALFEQLQLLGQSQCLLTYLLHLLNNGKVLGIHVSAQVLNSAFQNSPGIVLALDSPKKVLNLQVQAVDSGMDAATAPLKNVLDLLHMLMK